MGAIEPITKQLASWPGKADLANNHLGYSITWFGLALTLVPSVTEPYAHVEVPPGVSMFQVQTSEIRQNLADKHVRIAN